MRAAIVPPLDLQSVLLGTVRVGEVKDDRMVIKAKKPFKILKIECADERFAFKPFRGISCGAYHSVHVYQRGKRGSFSQKIVVQTDLAENPNAEATVTGNVSE